LGSIPFSYIVAKKIKGVDIRVVGEGNVGGRNVWHVVGKKYGAIAGGLDFTLLGIKRLIDEPYMRKIKEVSGW